MKGGFEPPADRQVFTLPLTIRPEDIDENGHVNNVVYVRWIQDAGTAHWRAHFTEEEARARTWVGEPKGARFDRYVLIEGPSASASRDAPNGPCWTAPPCGLCASPRRWRGRL